MNNFDVPEVILERYNQLCELVEKSQKMEDLKLLM